MLINLCVGEIFKESTEFKVTVNYITKLATYFQNSNNKFFIIQLKELQYKIYEKHIIPIVLVETRWNKLTISYAIFEIIDSNNFWNNFVLLTEILDPYCRILNVLQSDKACLFQVIYGLGYLHQF
ncbi:hypothetical protein C1645_813712 [Glomus cerebriforme]|uniref:Protein kinase domain-containing protein n=1 Tax=Glomus cerebriforme TaxID=658196 RepID=A0A397TS02_9GLOM|nr:hypothetical protein C1645_813712 [Glomus cerebriforme]